MYLSAQRLAEANRAVKDTFEQSSVVWQAIPHWETGDAGQSRVADGVPSTPAFLDLELEDAQFQVTLAQASAPTPDALLTMVIAHTVELAAAIDAKVLNHLFKNAKQPDLPLAGTDFNNIVTALIDARAVVEDAGYRAPSCLITNTEGLKKLSTAVTGEPIKTVLQSVANVNSLHRATNLEGSFAEDQMLMLMLGRRQRIAQGGASEASAGEEPVDLAVSVAPSLEVVGETAAGGIELAVRIRFATRVKDSKGVVAVREAPTSSHGL
jgi:hypothetical protein